MALNIAFQMDAIETANPKKDNTLWMMLGALARGHEVYYYTPDRLSMDSAGVFAYMQRVVSVDVEAEPFYECEAISKRDVAEMDMVLVRQDPPFDMGYITKGYLLERIKDMVLVVNDPVSVNRFSEKLIPFAFTEFMPETLISEDVEVIGEFLLKHGRAIMKPLYLFGGSDIHDVAFCDEWREAARGLIDKTGGSIVVQQFVPEVKDGDKRILLLDGEIVGAFNRVPAEGSLIANIAQGGSIVTTEITSNDRLICEALKPFLLEYGLTICGIDVIGEYLTEVNVTSPMGYRQAEDLYGVDITSTFWEVLEAKL